MPSTGFLEIRPKQVVEVYDGDTFKIDLQGVHPLFGDKLPIRVKGIDTPELRGTTEEIKALAEQARELTENTLKGAGENRAQKPGKRKILQDRGGSVGGRQSLGNHAQGKRIGPGLRRRRGKTEMVKTLFFSYKSCPALSGLVCLQVFVRRFTSGKGR